MFLVLNRSSRGVEAPPPTGLVFYGTFNLSRSLRVAKDVDPYGFVVLNVALSIWYLLIRRLWTTPYLQGKWNRRGGG